MHQALEQMCAQQVPGDTHRNLAIHPTFSGQTFKHILVPIWLLTYVFGSKSFQVLVNGSTGRIAGKYPLVDGRSSSPWSWRSSSSWSSSWPARVEPPPLWAMTCQHPLVRTSVVKC